MADDTESPPEGSNTALKQRKPGRPFVKGDPRINRKGRPKSFDQLRALIQSIGAEQAEIGADRVVIGGKVGLVNGKPAIIGGHIATNTEMAVRQLMKESPEKFLRGGWGDPPPPAPVNALQSIVGHLPKPYLDRILAGEPVDVVFAAWASEHLQTLQAKKE